MWPRASEAVLAVWLLVSAFLFALPEEVGTSVAPLLAGVAVLALVWMSRRHLLAHFLVVAVAVLLIAWGWAAYPRPGPAAAQNAIITGLLLGLVGIIPNRASDPPPGWRPHVQEQD